MTTSTSIFRKPTRNHDSHSDLGSQIVSPQPKLGPVPSPREPAHFLQYKCSSDKVSNETLSDTLLQCGREVPPPRLLERPGSAVAWPLQLGHSAELVVQTTESVGRSETGGGGTYRVRLCRAITIAWSSESSCNAHGDILSTCDMFSTTIPSCHRWHAAFIPELCR